MKKIAFVMTSLNTGGIATSLLNLLCELQAFDDLEIDVILFRGQPSDRERIPERVQIHLPGKMAELIAISVSEAKKRGLGYYIPKCFFGVLCKLFGHGIAYKMMFRRCRRYREYDYAISCSQSAPLHDMYGGCNEFVLQNIKAKQKIAFIHCDYVTYGINDRYSRKIYEKFDKIAVVSDSVGKVFLGEEPGMAAKTVTVKNCHNIEKIIKGAAQDPVTYDPDELNILTVARLGKEKGHIRVLKGLKLLQDNGIAYKWHLVGGDAATAPAELLEGMREYGVEPNVVFHGVQSNPYRYMPNADLLLVPSFHEAAPMVFDEACFLHLPIVTTKTVSAKEMVEDRGIGLVCDNTDGALSQALLHIAANRQLLARYRERTYHITADNSLALAQFMSMIGD